MTTNSSVNRNLAHLAQHKSRYRLLWATLTLVHVKRFPPSPLPTHKSRVSQLALPFPGSGSLNHPNKKEAAHFPFADATHKAMHGNGSLVSPVDLKTTIFDHCRLRVLV
jgi:hypothetical protein